ncbi:hypothetical protein QUA82_26610 [Microcoleus sp. F8-D3]
MKAALRLKLELGVRSQESGEKSQKEEVRSQKKCFYKYEMLPTGFLPRRGVTADSNCKKPGFFEF